MGSINRGLPAYLQRYIAHQDYDAYTAQDHAAWRFIMRQNCAFFSKHGVGIYLEGLKATGIRTDAIPRISDIDACLSKLGWRAVAVKGFIPPAAFLDFQARGVLPIACDMRSIQHIAYTPAPDIVHEAAGHAPILADAAYARYLHRYAAMAQKAIFSAEDVRLYEAIRLLSDIKENPDTKPEQIVEAEQRLIEVTRSIQNISEAARVARMNWWTVEYGLMGKIDAPKIYGAGLLSSVGESQNCLSNKVRKIPLSVDCVNTPYNITEPQPQLFVASNMEQLVDVLEEFEKTLSFVQGGIAGLEEAQKAATVTTTELDSGLEMSGTLQDFARENNRAEFLRYTGPVQLSLGSAQLEGHGKEHHPTGFSSPLGRWKGAPLKPMCELTNAELEKMGLEPGRSAALVFESGFTVAGKLTGWLRAEEKLLLLTWKDCRVTRGSQVYFRPEWGDFDMAVGEKILSVRGGAADREAYGEMHVGTASSSPARTSKFSDRELALFETYAQIRKYRTTSKVLEVATVDKLADQILSNHANEWLLQLELLELAPKVPKANWRKAVVENLRRLEKTEPTTTSALIQKGLELAKSKQIYAA